MGGATTTMDELQRRLGYAFRQPMLLETALTHRSWSFERERVENYERLEFLGDAVLGALTSEWLYQQLDEAEGELSKRKSFVVSAPCLAAHARVLDLDESIRLGVGEERSGGREKDSLLADSMEAIIGAVYLDGGLDAARGVVLPMIEAGVRHYEDAAGVTDFKTTLQEVVQAGGRSLPEYVLVDESGPDHRKQFTVEVRIEQQRIATATGPSKKKAEQAAAALALEELES